MLTMLRFVVMLSARANMLLCHVITKLGENSEYTRCQDGY